MSKVLVEVRIGDKENKNYDETIQVKINSIDYLIIKDCMDVCSDDEYDESWDRFIGAIERQADSLLPPEWYVKGTMELTIIKRFY